MGIIVERCLICDDHAMMRAALSGTITLLYPDAVCTLASDFDAAIRAALAMRPDLILCDLAMPGAEPLTGVMAVMAAAPDAALIVITGSEDDALLLALLRGGVSGFLHKSASAEVVEAAIGLVAAGGRYLPPRLLTLAAVPGSVQSPAGGSLNAQQHGLRPMRLTERQQQILRMIAAGLSNKQIARDLALSPATVKTHVAALIASLDVTNRTEAVYRAREIGIFAD